MTAEQERTVGRLMNMIGGSYKLGAEAFIKAWPKEEPALIREAIERLENPAPRADEQAQREIAVCGLMNLIGETYTLGADHFIKLSPKEDPALIREAIDRLKARGRKNYNS